ncbi:unnamed protein product [Sphenostylis stenocarpa]|uniref:Uncharacterized protein n=1 Tax=Sphenostylis stenocarpa TaxID=92480 RepID=A0AA86S841_9FABA|nr:unnamed protein product [Sphenostylis stenocarpa]
MAQESPTLKLHQLLLISPPQDTSPTSLSFTFFDVLWLRFRPVERLFFYELPNSTISFFDTILPNLKHSLSLTLQHFLPLAGTITWPLHSPLPSITYTPGNSITFTIAESNADFTTISESNHRHHLIPHLSISHDQASVLALQLTLFPNQGFCIGITSHHAALDGKSSTLFIKSWAHLCSHLKDSHSPPPQQQLPKHLTPSFDRSTIKDPSGIGEVYANSWLSFGGETNNRSLQVLESLSETETDLVKGVFVLTADNIKKLKNLVQSKVVEKNKVRVTSFSVTCGYVVWCAVRVGEGEGEGERVVFVFTVDCRSRLEDPVEGTYFGNCVVPRLVEVKREEVLGDEGFVKCVEGISEELKEVEGGVLSGVKEWFLKIQSVMGERLFSVAGSPRFEVYGVDFGWGRPRRVDVPSVDKTGAFSLSESRDDGGGIEIGLALNKDRMEKFKTFFYQGI